jgi:serine/threonine protein kinase
MPTMESTSYHLVTSEPLDRILLTMESRKASSDVFIDSSAGAARVSLRDGWLVDAEFGDLTGVAAISAVLRLREGKYCIKAGREPSRRSMNHRVSDVLQTSGQEVPSPANAEGLHRIGTVPLGPRVALTDKPKVIGGKTMSGWSPAVKKPGSKPIDLVNRKAHGTTTPGASREKGPPARYAARSAQPTETRYSSVPPPSLAEEHVAVPRTGASQAPETGRRHPSSGRSGAALRKASVPAEKPRSPIDERELDEEVVRAARGQLRESEMPVPSSRLSPDALKQLDLLNEALGSAPRFGAPFSEMEDSARPFSQVPEPNGDFTMPSRGLAARGFVPLENPVPPTDSPAPESSRHTSSGPSSDTGSQSLIAPGSVPHPNLLPGGQAAQKQEGGLPVVGRYQVLARLKRGGMGSVYMCRLSGSAGFRRLFAMKVLHSHLAGRPGALDAFFHEAQVLGNLHHRNIVGIADVGSATDPYIVLDYVEGGSLAELYRATKKISRDPAVIVSIILDALSGLSAAHSATDETGQRLDLVHCDVTPHNLLVGIDGTCRLTDFGIARTGYIDPREEVIQGKPGYLAPERIRQLPSDHRSDIFSLGVVLYAGLTGIEPFSGETSEATMKRVLEVAVAPPSRVGCHPPPCLDAICLRALARDPNERFQSAEEMAEQLRRVALREGLLAGPEEVAAWVRRHLSPTLEARRIASMRGAASAEEQKNWATLPPPEVNAASNNAASNNAAGNNAAGNEFPPDAPSAAGHTGPLEAPPPSSGFNDRTEILTGLSRGPSRPKGATFAVYLLITLAMAALVWVVLQPGSLSTLLSGGGEEKHPEPQTVDEPVTAPAPKAPASDGKDPDRIVIPDITTN